MSEKPKHSWRRFSLRTMFVLVTLVAVASARVGYLYQRAEFHESEGDRFFAEWRKGKGKSPGTKTITIGELLESAKDETFDESVRHFGLADEYRAAMYRPWQVIDETKSALPTSLAPSPNQSKK